MMPVASNGGHSSVMLVLSPSHSLACQSPFSEHALPYHVHGSTAYLPYSWQDICPTPGRCSPYELIISTQLTYLLQQLMRFLALCVQVGQPTEPLLRMAFFLVVLLMLVLLLTAVPKARQTMAGQLEGQQQQPTMAGQLEGQQQQPDGHRLTLVAGIYHTQGASINALLSVLTWLLHFSGKLPANTELVLSTRSSLQPINLRPVTSLVDVFSPDSWRAFERAAKVTVRNAEPTADEFGQAELCVANAVYGFGNSTPRVQPLPPFVIRSRDDRVAVLRSQQNTRESHTYLASKHAYLAAVITTLATHHASRQANTVAYISGMEAAPNLMTTADSAYPHAGRKLIELLELAPAPGFTIPPEVRTCAYYFEPEGIGTRAIGSRAAGNQAELVRVVHIGGTHACMHVYAQAHMHAHTRIGAHRPIGGTHVLRRQRRDRPHDRQSQHGPRLPSHPHRQAYI